MQHCGGAHDLGLGVKYNYDTNEYYDYQYIDTNIWTWVSINDDINDRTTHH